MSRPSVRGVLDTNVLVSAALLTGPPRKAFDKLLDNGTILVSEPVILELAGVLNRERFDRCVTYEDRIKFLVGFMKVAEMVEGCRFDRSVPRSKGR